MIKLVQQNQAINIGLARCQKIEPEEKKVRCMDYKSCLVADNGNRKSTNKAPKTKFRFGICQFLTLKFILL